MVDSSALGNPLVFFNLLSAPSRLIANRRDYERSHSQAVETYEHSDKADRLHRCEWRCAQVLPASLEGDDYRQDWLMVEEQDWRATAALLLSRPMPGFRRRR